MIPVSERQDHDEHSELQEGKVIQVIHGSIYPFQRFWIRVRYMSVNVSKTCY